MKKWYCPNCKTFKRFKRTRAGYVGYPDTYHCRCCGTELINTNDILEELVVKHIKHKKTVEDITKELRNHLAEIRGVEDA